MKNYVLYVIVFICLCVSKLLAESEILLNKAYEAFFARNISNEMLIELRHLSTNTPQDEEAELQIKLLFAVALASLDTPEDIAESMKTFQEIYDSYPDTWASDFSQYGIISCYGLLGKQSEQISLAEIALQTIDFNRWDLISNEFVGQMKKHYNFTSTDFKNQIYAILGYAYRWEGDFVKAEEAYQNISDIAFREYELKQLGHARENKMREIQPLKETN